MVFTRGKKRRRKGSHSLLSFVSLFVQLSLDAHEAKNDREENRLFYRQIGRQLVLAAWDEKKMILGLRKALSFNE